MTGKMAFQRDKRLAKVVPTIKLGALNVSPPVRMSPCPHRLQIQAPGFFDGGILTGKMTIWRDKSCSHYADLQGRNLLSIFYCLQVANRLMYPVTANIPINSYHSY